MDLKQTEYRALLLAPQALAGTPTVLVPATHGMLVMNGDYKLQADQLRRENDKAGHGAKGYVNVKKRVTFAGGVEMRGAAVVGAAAPYGRVLRACGFIEDLDPGVSAVYGLATEDQEIFTAQGYSFGSSKSGHDVRGAVTNIDLSIQNFAKLQFQMVGLAGAVPVADGALPAANYSAFQVPVPIQTESFEVDVGGFALNTISLKIDTGATVDIYEGSEGRFVFWSAPYRPTGTLRVYKEQRSAFDPEDKAFQHLTQNMFAEIVGGGETVRVDLTGVQLGVPIESDERGLSAWDIPFEVQGDTPTNCLSISHLVAP